MITLWTVQHASLLCNCVSYARKSFASLRTGCAYASMSGFPTLVGIADSLVIIFFDCHFLLQKCFGAVSFRQLDIPSSDTSSTRNGVYIKTKSFMFSFQVDLVAVSWQKGSRQNGQLNKFHSTNFLWDARLTLSHFGPTPWVCTINPSH